MPGPLEERRPTMSPGLARRVAILGGAAFILFAALFFRLWFLEVLSGDDYVSQAAENRVRKIKIEAPRGDIVDRKGNTLVKTRQAAVVQLLPNKLPESEKQLAAEYGGELSAAERDRLAAKQRLRDLRQRDASRSRKAQRRKPSPSERRERRRLRRASRQAVIPPIPPMSSDPKVTRLYGRLGRILEVEPRTIHRRVIDQVAKTPYAAVTIRTDIPKAAFTYLLERQEKFPAVRPEIKYLRSYPYKDLGAHLFGTLREISPAELKEKRYREVSEGERIGKDGIEDNYDRYLRGQDGYTSQVVDALGQNCDDPVRCRERRVKPQQGQQLQLTLDLRLEKAAAASLASIGAGRPGAFVAMDPRNGEVLAMGSYPTFDANLFAKPISREKYAELNSEEADTPLFNRAMDGTYPTGSTFKLVTATAALQEGLIGPTDIVDDPGSVTYSGQEFKNAGDAVNGPINIVKALTVSSDVFFYKLGARMNEIAGDPLQTWAKRLGIGHATGIDLPGEFDGLLPTREYRNEGFAEYQDCVDKNHLVFQSEEALFKCGGIDKEWTVGDNVNLSVGQGDLQATPLQMAVAYAAIENGGTVVQPHLGLEVQDGQGAIRQKLRSPARKKLDISQTTLDTIRTGLRAAASPGGTSGDVFKDVDLEVYGKTGTAERGYGNEDQSWYLAFVPDASRPIVVAVTVERGGFGAETAAPIACHILTTWFDQSPSRCHAGASTTA